MSAPENVRVTGGVSVGESVAGPRTLRATAEDDSGKVARVEFYVSDTLACTDEVAKDSGAIFTCTWDFATSPPGKHQLTAKAYDAAGNSASSVTLAFTVSSLNQPPTISQVTATPAAVDEDSSTVLSVSASDPDGDPLTYSWTQLPVVPAGTFGTETGATRTWKSPFVSRNTSFSLRVTVSDGKGGSAQGSVTVVVANVPALNRAPSVDDAITAPTTRVVAGDAITLSLGASDLDGDPLTYSWTTAPAGEGTFTNRTDSVTEWRSPAIGAAKVYSFQVTVSDGTASVTRSVNVPVDVPTYARDIQQLWTPACTGCHNDSSGTFGSLSLEAASSYAALVNKSSVGACSSLKRVLPGQPDDSVLMLKISGESCGGRMPQGDVDYYERNPSELTRIRSWILAGALNN